jgi:proteasome lid subunit RPN8/RPN11
MPNPIHTIKFSVSLVVPRIMELGLVEAPHEACGVVIPDFNAPPDSWVHAMKNRSSNPLNSFNIDPQTVRSILLDRDTFGKDVWDDVLVWHTHPGGLVGPSDGDMKTRIAGLKYLVVTLPGGEASMY